MSKSWSVDTFKLPEIKFTRRAARSHRRVPADNGDPGTNVGDDKVTQRLMALQEEISNYREEHDFVFQMKSSLYKRLAEVKGALQDLKNSAESVNDFEAQLAVAEKNEVDAFAKSESVKTLHKNLVNLVSMCERHPACVPALNEELASKSELDSLLLAEIKRRLWEQKFEKQMHSIYFRKMKTLVKEGVDMHSELLGYRYSMRKGLTVQQLEDEKRLKSSTESRVEGKTLNRSKATRGSTKGKRGTESEPAIQNQEQTWDDIWSIICSRTGISEPEIFFQRINNGKILEEQINSIKRASEGRLEFLRKELVTVESELEESRYDASISGGQSTKEQQKELTDKQFALRHIKERTEAAEQLQQNVIGGLVHLGEMLGVPAREEESSIADLQRDIETLFDLLLEEREKQQGQPHSVATNDHGRNPVSSITATNPETHHRSPELDFIVTKYESPKVRLPSKIPSRPQESNSITSREASEDLDEVEDEGMWDRLYVKTQSLKSVKQELKKASRQIKNDALNSTI